MFRFTIRDVLWLTVVVALAVGGGSTAAITSPMQSNREPKRRKSSCGDSEVRKRNAKFAEDLRRDVLAGRIGVVP